MGANAPVTHSCETLSSQSCPKMNEVNLHFVSTRTTPTWQPFRVLLCISIGLVGWHDSDIARMHVKRIPAANQALNTEEKRNAAHHQHTAQPILSCAERFSPTASESVKQMQHLRPAGKRFRIMTGISPEQKWLNHFLSQDFADCRNWTGFGWQRLWAGSWTSTYN